MKFLNGYWLNRDGYKISHAAEAYRVKTESDKVTILAPCNKINHRGDTLGGPVITVELSSPMPDVIRVKTFHYKVADAKRVSFELNTAGADVKISESEENVTLKSGSLSVQVKKAGEWSMDFFNGDKKITSSGFRHLAYIEGPENSTFMREQLDLDIGECVYGMGEKFTPLVKNGQTVDIWNEDGGTCTEQSYKNIPFYLTSKGYGVFINNPGRVSFEVATEVVSRTQFSVPGEELEYYIMNGPSIKDVLKNYTALTGRPAMPPLWSFGLWLSTSFVTNYDEKTVSSFVDKMAQYDIPLSVFHFDCFWMKEFNWCDFEWDDKMFPEPKEMLTRLKAKGLKICVWINPYISQQSSLFDEGVEKGYFIRKTNGDVWQWDLWQPGMAIVDFTNPDACNWFADKLGNLVDMGVDCFKTDFGERIPTEDVVFYNGANPEQMHNLYTYYYNKTVYGLIHSKNEEAVVFARSATAGSQKFPVHWGGDCFANYASMAETLRGGLSLGLSGFGFWSHDISGFEDTAPADLYKRWVAFGLLSSHSRLHGNSSYRVPWMFDEEAVDVVRFFTKLKCRMMPYLYKTASEATTGGVPMLRAMVLEFQDDPACCYLDRQYMLGDSLLVAPVFQEEGIVSYYLPHGTWYNILTKEQIDGGCWKTEKHGYHSLPLLIRPNHILALGSHDDTTVYDFEDSVSFLIAPLSDGIRVQTVVLGKDGTEKLQLCAEKTANTITIRANGVKTPWTACLLGIESCRTVTGAALTKNASGLVLTPSYGNSTIQIEL